MITAGKNLRQSRFFIPGVALVVVAAIAVGVALVLILGNDNSSSQTGGAGSPPADLVRVRDSLPRLSDQKDFATDMYTGGSFMDAVYFTNASPSDVASFFTNSMKSSWPQISSVNAVPATDGKSGAGVQFTATKADATVTVTAIPSGKDPSLGKTQISIRIERRNQ